jgi:hypothetical protein
VGRVCLSRLQQPSPKQGKQAQHVALGSRRE